MRFRAFCLAALFLLLIAGCSTTGSAPGARVGSFKRLPGLSWSDSPDEAFAKAVENDPFPQAGTGQVQVAVGP
jgi:hypothetical protein